MNLIMEADKLGYSNHFLIQNFYSWQCFGNFVVNYIRTNNGLAYKTEKAMKWTESEDRNIYHMYHDRYDYH